jgi:hypothetical protein
MHSKYYRAAATGARNVAALVLVVLMLYSRI